MDKNKPQEDKFCLSKLKEWYTVGTAEYSVAHRRAVKLDAADRGKLWEAIEARFPAYQILPDSNWVSYIKQNILASIYTVGKSARLIPTSEDDKEIVEQLNIALEHTWGTLDIPQIQMEAGERAALLNIGITQVGWDNSICAGLGDAFHKGDVVLKNIDPLKFMRDPFAIDLDHAAWCVTWDTFHKSVIKDNPRYKEKFDEYVAKAGSADAASQVTFLTDKVSRTSMNKKDYYTVYTWYVNDNGKVHEIHTLNNECELYRKEDIKPSCFPFAILYCNLPSGDLFGTSECAKVFSNNVAYNLLNSIMLTSEYKNQRPPRFINGQSGINVPAFVKHGNDADRTFVVQGDASKAVHYQQYPQPSAQSIGSMQQLGVDIKNVSGVDDRYTGRDTGSILTTGGVESMMDQVTMIDAAKISNYEKYTRRLTNLVISNYITFSRKRKYFHKNPTTNKWKSIDVDFPKVDVATIFDYEIAISTELPKSKARVEAVADHLMEMQMQYQGQGVDVDIITPEEWLMMKDIPMREYMQERMGIQRTQNWVSLVSQAVTEYGGLVSNGVAPDDAIAATADTIGRMSQPGAGNAVADQMGAMQDMGMVPNGNAMPMPGM